MLSYLSSLTISVLRSFDTEANRFYDRNHQMYDAALLTRCYTQHAFRPFIDSKSNPELNPKYVYQPAGHIVTGNLKIISDSRIRKIVSKGPKYLFPSYIHFDKFREEIASALNDFRNRWCKLEGVEVNARKEWKKSIFTIVDKSIQF